MAKVFYGAALAVVLSLGCAPGDMEPGKSCGSCHTGGSGFRSGPRFGLGGTVYTDRAGSDGLSLVRIDVTDVRGTQVHLTSNDVGNFYTKDPLVPPLSVTLTGDGASTASMTAPSGDCNGCHARGASPGRIHIP